MIYCSSDCKLVNVALVNENTMLAKTLNHHRDSSDYS